MGCILCKCCESVKESKKDESFGTAGNIFVPRKTHKSLSVLDNVPEVYPTLEYSHVSHTSLEQVQVYENSGASENQLVLGQTCGSVSVPESLQLSKRYENLRASKSLPELYHTQEFLGVSVNLPKHIKTYDVLDAVLEEKTNLDTSSSHPLGEIYFLAKDLSIENLPENFQVPEIFLYLKACIDLVVRVAVGHTSASRSEKDIIQNFRDEHSTRYGSGVVFKVYSVKNSADLCSCRVCESSSHKQRIAGKVYVITSSHMVYDQSEAKSTTVDLFYDDESDKDNIRTIHGSDVIHGNDLNGRCIIECVSHNRNLTDKLMHIVENEDKQRKDLGIFFDEVMRSELLRKIHVEEGGESVAVCELKKHLEWIKSTLVEGHDEEDRCKALMENLSDTSGNEKLSNQTGSSTESVKKTVDGRTEDLETEHKRLLENINVSDNQPNISRDDILSSDFLKKLRLAENGCSESEVICSKKSLADEAGGGEQRDEATEIADAEKVLGRSGKLFGDRDFVNTLEDEVSKQNAADVSRQSYSTDYSDGEDIANRRTPTNLSVIVCHPNGHSKQVCIKELKREVKTSSCEVQCEGQKVFYSLHFPPLPSQHVEEDCSAFEFGACEHQHEISEEKNAAGQSSCTKNQNHELFIPLSEFKKEHIPKPYNNDFYHKLILAMAAITVRLRVKFISMARPDGYVFAQQRGKNIIALGSGCAIGIEENCNPTKECPCPQCKDSKHEQQKAWFIRIRTANHLIFDTKEAENTTVDVFYDNRKKKEDMRTLYGVEVVTGDIKEDICELICVTHDEAVYNRLKGNLITFDELQKKFRSDSPALPCIAVIVSHPHGTSKKISFQRVPPFLGTISAEGKRNIEIALHLTFMERGLSIIRSVKPENNLKADGTEKSEMAGIEVTVLYPDGTNDKCCIWQMDKKVIETKKWLLQHGGIHEPDENFCMVIKLDETESQVMVDNNDIDYYWDDLCEAQYIYFQLLQPQ